MTTLFLTALSGATALVALLYSTVGHAGASGYIAVMALFGLSPQVIKPTALILNILVAVVTTRNFHKAGHFQGALFWPFAFASVPCAFLGGYLNLPAALFKTVVGVALWLSAARFVLQPKAQTATRRPTLPVSLLVGAALGLLAGITGTGGGIFLTPLLLLMGWADAKQAAGASAPFILLNSVAGLGGLVAHTNHVPLVALPLAVAALGGGVFGSTVGSTRLAARDIERLLAVVLAIAGTKLVFY